MSCIGQFPPGPYQVTWDGQPAGLMEGPLRLQMTPAGQDVRASRWGQTVITSIYLGSNDFIIGVFKEWTPAVRAMMWPFATWPSHGQIGRLMSCRESADSPLFGPSRELVLTAVAATPAAQIGPVTLTAPRACLAPQHTLDVSLGPEERLIALVFRLYPIEEHNELATFTVTHPA